MLPKTVGIQQSQQQRKVRLNERNHIMAKKKLVKELWSKREVSLLKKLFPNNPTATVATGLGRSTNTEKKKASRMGLKKSKKYLKSLDRA
jgi:hypothetical protein